MKERLPYIDVAKGFAIYLMILGHQYVSDQTFVYIYSFHMPLFFYISGMFFRNSKPFFLNLESAVRGLLIPYLFFSVLNLLICWISPYLHPELYYNMKGWEIFRAAINGIFIGTDQVMPTSFLPLGPLWFLVALFVVRVFCSALSSGIKNEYLWGGVCLFVSIGLFYIINVPVFSLRSAMLSTPFYCMGFLLRRVDFRNISYKPFLLLVLLIYFVMVVPLNGKCDIDAQNYGNWMVVFYMNSLVGIFITLLLSTYVGRYGSFVKKMGENTLVILGMVAFFTKPLQVMSVYLFGYDSMCSPLYIIIVPVLVIIGSMAIAIPIKKYIPFAVGKKKVRQPSDM